MIYRQVTTEFRDLVRQKDHAQLAFEMAQHWNDPIFRDRPDYDQLLKCIRHHDDGWTAYDDASEPDLDSPKWPRQFTEMPREISLQIWSDCVTSASEHGPLVQDWTSLHFSHFARQLLSSTAPDTNLNSALDSFLTQQIKIQNRCKQAHDHPELRMQGLTWLQFFDRLSLVALMRSQSVSESMNCPVAACEIVFRIDSERIEIQTALLSSTFRFRLPTCRWSLSSKTQPRKWIENTEVVVISSDHTTQ